MAPRKNTLTHAEFRSLIDKYRIRFYGPAPPGKWPQEHRHHFQIIRDIGSVLYDNYRANEEIPQERRDDFKKRVRDIRGKAYKFLDNIKTNESTWRELEIPILRRFDERVIWYVRPTSKCPYRLNNRREK